MQTVSRYNEDGTPKYYDSNDKEWTGSSTGKKYWYEKSGDRKESNMQYSQMGTPSAGFDMTYGDPEDGGGVIHLQNPYMMDPHAINPSAGGYLDNLNGMYDMYSKSVAGGAFNPEFYNKLHDTQQANLMTSMGNAYARAGLGGSSAAMGGMASAVENNDMNWMNRQQSDQRMALQGLMGINQAGYNMTTGIQNEYAGFQDEYNQNMLSFLGLKQGADGQNSSLWGDIIKGAGTAAGAGAALFGGGGGNNNNGGGGGSSSGGGGGGWEDSGGSSGGSSSGVAYA